MENPSQFTVFTRLQHENPKPFQFASQQLSFHTEASYPLQSHRYRLVYSSLDAQQSIDKWLQLLVQDLSLANISRNLGLQCLEICCAEPIETALLLAFKERTDIELFELASDAPTLSAPGLLVMDMDSTAIEIECIDELADMAGVGEQVAAITERAMQGELDFEQSLRARVEKLAGADAAIINTLCDKLPLMPGLVEMINELQAANWRIVVASGGFTPFVNHLKQLLNLDAAFANELVIEAGVLTGQVTGQVVDAQFKADTLQRCAEQWQISASQLVAIGDGANDIPMIEAAHYGIAYHAKPKLAQVANVAIDKLDLKVLPYLFQA